MKVEGKIASSTFCIYLSNEFSGDGRGKQRKRETYM